MKSWDANPAPLSTAKQFPASHSCEDQLRVEPVMPTAPPLPSNSPHPGVAWRSGLDQKAQSGALKPGFEPNSGALRLRPAKSGYSGKPLATRVLHHRNPKPKTMGVTYYGYRYYDPATGRWPSRDPIGEYGLPDDYEDYEDIEFVQIGNLYAFGPNDPINGFDRDGEIWGLVIRGVVWVGSKVGRFIKPRPIPRPPAPKPPTPKPPTPKPKPKPKGCKPCLPGIGTLMYRVDETGKPHGGIPCPHSHQFSVNQIPYPSCVCKINKTGVVLPGRHGPPVTPVAGGGKL